MGFANCRQNQPRPRRKKMLKCGWCGMAGRSVGTTSEYECGSSIGCAHQRQSPACKEIERLRKALTGIRDALEQIVVSEGQDAGVILLSSESPTYYDPEVNGQVYEHEYFSPLGDALVSVARLAAVSVPSA